MSVCAFKNGKQVFCPACGSARVFREIKRCIMSGRELYGEVGWYKCLDCWNGWDAVSEDGTTNYIIPAGIPWQGEGNNGRSD
jgi:hypothetical protein